MIKDSVIAAYSMSHYRKSTSTWAGGQHFLEIIVNAPIASAHGYTERVWSSNGKWTGTNSTHKITVTKNWYKNVWARGIACVDGLLTLDAEPVKEGLQGGEEAYYAQVVVQTKGVSIRDEGWILYRRNGGEWIHGTSVKNARNLNFKRLKALAEERLAKMQRKAKAMEEIQSLADLVVTRDDCGEAGLCDPGQRDWLAKRGLDENITSLPAQKLLEMAILSNDRIECVKRAISVARKRVEVYSMAS